MNAEETARAATWARRSARLRGMTPAGTLERIAAELADPSMRPKRYTAPFRVLDGIINGISPQLYAVGAVSSLGKTAFVMHLIEKVNETQGAPVLLMTLEMSRRDVLLRSIVRELYAGDKPGLAQPGDRPITVGRFNAGIFSEAERRVILDAMKRYAAKHPNFFISGQEDGRMTAEDIGALAGLVYSVTGAAPVVAVDYLQMIYHPEPRYDERRKTDENLAVLKKLATGGFSWQETQDSAPERVPPCPVVLISSLNRMSYKNPISLDSFKESGGIEYTCDVVIGLEPAGMEEGNEKGNKQALRDCKAADPRRIVLRVLKNRQGATGDGILFEFFPNRCEFKEAGPAEA